MKNRVKRRCLECGIEFEAQKHLLRKNRAKYCSIECKQKAISKIICGENHFNWKGGIDKKYPVSIWTPRLRKIIRKRDNYKCQICGEWDYNLDVHHLDENKQNCEQKNLITLCRSCHMKIHFGNKNIKNLEMEAIRLGRFIAS